MFYQGRTRSIKAELASMTHVHHRTRINDARALPDTHQRRTRIAGRASTTHAHQGRRRTRINAGRASRPSPLESPDTESAESPDTESAESPDTKSVRVRSSPCEYERV